MHVYVAIEYKETAFAPAHVIKKMSIDKSSKKQMRVDLKTHTNIEIFEIREQEDGNIIITSYGQPINNRSEDDQVCIYD